MNEIIKHIVPKEIQSIRVDRYLAKQNLGLTRNRILNLLKKKFIKVNKRIIKPSYLVRPNDRIVILLPPLEKPQAIPENIPLSIVYEDKHLILINKPAGLVVHPAKGHPNGTLVNALLYHCKDLAGVGDVLRPGIVQRLDKNTSGLMVVAKNDAAHNHLSHQIRTRSLTRIYNALVWGHLRTPKGKIDAPLGRSTKNRKRFTVMKNGKRAVTHYKVLNQITNISYLELKLETGRTHQIRVHLKHIGHPVFGDPDYDGWPNNLNRFKPEQRKLLKEALSILQRQALHSVYISFVHPATGKLMQFASELPEDIKQAWDILSSY